MKKNFNNLKNFPNLSVKKFKLDEHDKIENFIEVFIKS